MFNAPAHSIRWRLPLSYGAIVFFTAVVLGAVLLAILRSYYLERERAYLDSQAKVIGAILPPLLEWAPTTAAVNEQLEGLAFLTQARVRVLDLNQQVLADSGSPSPRAAVQLSASADITQTEPVRILFVRKAITASSQLTNAFTLPFPSPPISTSTAVEAKMDFFFQSPAPGLFLGSGLSSETEENAQRSAQSVRRPFYDRQNKQIGFVQLSEGPAYGRQIVASAALGTLAAGAIAIALASMAGFWISRQLSAPLVQLTAVTAQMAAGNLSARASITRMDELGVLARSFNEMAQRVEDTVTALRRFVADAAHELNTPLTALRTNLELAPPSDLTTRSIVQVMRLERLVYGLLDLSRLDAQPTDDPRVHIEAEANVELTTLVQAVSEPYASRAEQSDIAFVLDLPAAPVEVHGSRAQLEQALHNLLDNALKFTAPGGTVRIQLWHDATRVLVAVEDTGIGVPATELPLLFERFYRAHNAAAYPGNGLGLAIVKAIVERHGGTVWAEQKEQGMRFVLSLPYHG